MQNEWEDLTVCIQMVAEAPDDDWSIFISYCWTNSWNAKEKDQVKCLLICGQFTAKPPNGVWHEVYAVKNESSMLFIEDFHC